MAQPSMQDYSFGNRSADHLYEELARGRDQVIEKARSIARISIPTAFPPEGYKPGDYLPPPNQSINARCIVNLSSRIMLTGLPPGQPILKYNIIEHKLQKDFAANPALYSMTLLGLARREVANRQRLEATSTRTAYTEAAVQLLIAGNTLWRHLDIDSPSVHKMTEYVCKRNAVGAQLLAILKQVINLSDLDIATREFINNVRHSRMTSAERLNASEFSDEETIYCCCKLHVVSKKEKVWLYWEEFEGEMIPDTEVTTAYDAPPLFAAWMVPVYGSNWGTSYAELYEGDMYIVENANGSLNDGSEAAALTWLFVNPAGVTSKRVIEKAENLKVMHGNAADITVFRLDKAGDFQFVASHTERAERRLGQAFLQVSSVQRSGERVTAEEWVKMTAELDQAMGGLYATLAQGLGRHIVTRFIALQEEEDKDMPPLPKGVTRISVITGLDALSIDEEEKNLENALSVLLKVYGPEVLQGILENGEITRRVLAGNRVRPDGLVKGDQQQAAEQQQDSMKQAGMTVLDKAAGPVAKEGAAALAEGVTPQMIQQLQAAAQQPQ